MEKNGGQVEAKPEKGAAEGGDREVERAGAVSGGFRSGGGYAGERVSAGVKKGGDQEDADSKKRKVFIGGLSWDTNEDSLKEYFEQFGELIDCVIMRDRQTGKPRGFGFVTFAEESDAKAAVQQRHELDGREVEAKLAVPRGESNTTAVTGRPTKKIFVGGLPHDIRNPEFKEHFSKFGEVEDAQVMMDHRTGNSRGFGFVTFQDEESAEKVLGRGLQNTMIEVNGEMVEVKRAESRTALTRRGDGAGNNGSGRGDRRGMNAMPMGGNMSQANQQQQQQHQQQQQQMAQQAGQNVQLSPHLAAQYASYYGGTASMWQQWAAAQAAAVAVYQQQGGQGAAAPTGDQAAGYNAAANQSAGANAAAASVFQNLYNSYGGQFANQYGAPAGGDGRSGYPGLGTEYNASNPNAGSAVGGNSTTGSGAGSNGASRHNQSRSDRYHPYGR